jgi:cytochrome bd ubiquinol oxidase subunit I
MGGPVRWLERRSRYAGRRRIVSSLDFARAQMALSLAFHIVFAAVGIGVPVLMAVAEGLHLRTGHPVCLDLARRWARGTAGRFGVGAVGDGGEG